MKHNVKLLRQEEAWELLRSVKDTAVNQLMNRASFYATKRFISDEKAPVADFDLRFFLEVMEDFFRNREAIQRILNGENLQLWPDDEL